MKNLSLTFCLAIAAFFGSVGGGFAGSDLPPCPSSGNLHNCFGTYTYAHGSKYVGEFRDNEFNGQGTFKYSSGTEYIGEFKNGKFNGQGILTYADGTVEDGFWKDDAFVGK